jgi:hypothetical protein
MRVLGFQGPPQPSPALGDALNAGYRYLEVKCLGCNTHQIVALTSCGDRRQRWSLNSKLHALPPVLRSPGPCLQAKPSRRAAGDEDFSQRSAVNVVAGRTVRPIVFGGQMPILSEFLQNHAPQNGWGTFFTAAFGAFRCLCCKSRSQQEGDYCRAECFECCT